MVISIPLLPARHAGSPFSIRWLMELVRNIFTNDSPLSPQMLTAKSKASPITACAILRYISWYARIIIANLPSHDILNIQTIAFFFQHFQICLIGFVVSGLAENIVLLLLCCVERYKQLAGKADPSDKDYAEMTELEMYLDEVPDCLALDFATEYARLNRWSLWKITGTTKRFVRQQN